MADRVPRTEPHPQDVEYVHALDCGHRMYISPVACAGIEWCPTCNGYSGVIIQRVSATSAALQRRSPDSDSPAGVSG